MISEELLEEIIFLSKQDKLIDRNMIRKIVSQVILNSKEVSIFDYSGVLFKNRIDSFAETDIDDGFISVNLRLCYIELSKKNYTTLYKNLWLVLTLLHEIEHLKEPYKIKQNNLDGKLIEVSNYVYRTNLRDELYYLNPSEKIAYAKSSKYLLESLKQYPNFKKENLLEYKAIINEHVRTLKYGYRKKENGKYNIPLFEFMYRLGILDNFEDLYFKVVPKGKQTNINKYSTEEKFMYGLPVSIDEMLKLDQVKKIKAKQIG